MPKKVYNNIEDYRLIDNGRVCEDVTSVELPAIEHVTSDIDAAGMTGVVSMPNQAKVAAMSFAVSHNNGTNCNRLVDSGTHKMEFRLVRQRYNVPKGRIEHESVKYRVTGVYVSTDAGSAERDNPLGSTENFSVLRDEKIMNGQTVELVDVMAGIIRKNGADTTDEVQALLK